MLIVSHQGLNLYLYLTDRISDQNACAQIYLQLKLTVRYIDMLNSN